MRTLIAWTGNDPDREGLAGMPGRVVRAYEEFFAGYREDPVATRFLGAFRHKPTLRAEFMTAIGTPRETPA